MTLSDFDRLELVRKLLDDDILEESEWILRSRPDSMSPREQAMAKLLIRLYTAVHPNSRCGNPHEEWDERNFSDLKKT